MNAKIVINSWRDSFACEVISGEIKVIVDNLRFKLKINKVKIDTILFETL